MVGQAQGQVPVLEDMREKLPERLQGILLVLLVRELRERVPEPEQEERQCMEQWAEVAAA